MIRNIFGVSAALASCLCPVAAAMAAQPVAGQPVPWQMGLQDAATPIMEEIRWFEHYTLWFVVPITLFVLLLLIIVAIRYNAKANPVASKTTHNTMIEVVWTVVPILLLFAIAIPSFNLLTEQLTPPENPDVTIKATATQWQWNYEYQMETPVSFDSFLLKDEDRAAAGKEDHAIYPRLLAVDNELVVPVGKTVRMLVTSAPTDVIHAFAMPAFGIKIDAVPGRLNETWFKAEKEGLYYGQCSELCGKDHAFMPIAIRVVPNDKYERFLASAASDLPGAYRNLLATAVRDDAKAVDVAANDAE